MESQGAISYNLPARIHLSHDRSFRSGGIQKLSSCRNGRLSIKSHSAMGIADDHIGMDQDDPGYFI
ncbi:MAG TPA: hypothetical protein DIW81_14735 [Planctomycetaceae bacterium]|nr:hypothetical protein [Rubinisphaera sp.]HCS52824.1 hypothetical protein [Planctomycetaceae bacterium]